MVGITVQIKSSCVFKFLPRIVWTGLKVKMACAIGLHEKTGKPNGSFEVLKGRNDEIYPYVELFRSHVCRTKLAASASLESGGIAFFRCPYQVLS